MEEIEEVFGDGGGQTAIVPSVQEHVPPDQQVPFSPSHPVKTPPQPSNPVSPAEPPDQQVSSHPAGVAAAPTPQPSEFDCSPTSPAGTPDFDMEALLASPQKDLQAPLQANSPELPAAAPSTKEPLEQEPLAEASQAPPNEVLPAVPTIDQAPLQEVTNSPEPELPAAAPSTKEPLEQEPLAEASQAPPNEVLPAVPTIDQAPLQEVTNSPEPELPAAASSSRKRPLEQDPLAEAPQAAASEFEAPPPAPLVPEEVPSGAPRASGFTRGPKMFSSPAALMSISPPGCSIRLNRLLALPTKVSVDTAPRAIFCEGFSFKSSLGRRCFVSEFILQYGGFTNVFKWLLLLGSFMCFVFLLVTVSFVGPRFQHSQGNDHRWTAAFQPALKIPSFSRSFSCENFANWSTKLADVHEHAWSAWSRQLSEQNRFKLDEDKIQTGGSIPQDILEGLKGTISELPPVKKICKEVNIIR